MTPFNQASYLAQVRRLRRLAKIAVARFPIRVRSLHFINHGENTTFRVEALNGKKYLLRIHRDGYHSERAIQEELRWLSLLAKRQSVITPVPVKSKAGRLIETVAADGIPGTRFCCLFQWIDGRFMGKGVTTRHLRLIGATIGKLQNCTPKSKVRYRRYWDAEGLVGINAKFGSIDKLANVNRKTQELITQTRRMVLKKLREFEQRFPKKVGLIHADMHFGNVLLVGNSLGVIDFDDCGLGFHAYDLAIPLTALENIWGQNDGQRITQFKEALIIGYKTERAWDRYDDEILPFLITARRLLMLGWLNSRTDNPRLKKYLKKNVAIAVTHIKTHHRGI